MNGHVPDDGDYTERRRNISLIGSRFGADVAQLIEELGVAGTRVAAELAWSDEDEGMEAAEQIQISADKARVGVAQAVAQEMLRQGEQACADSIAQFLELPTFKVLQAFSDLRAAGWLND